jgi:hypothetical protein
MKYKAGDLVWVKVVPANLYLPPGEYAGTVKGPSFRRPHYTVEIEGYSMTDDWTCDAPILRPRKPPDELKREEVGAWDLCPWQPRVKVPLAV